MKDAVVLFLILSVKDVDKRRFFFIASVINDQVITKHTERIISIMFYCEITQIERYPEIIDSLCTLLHDRRYRTLHLYIALCNSIFLESPP